MTELLDLPAKDAKPIKGGRLDTPDRWRRKLKGTKFIVTVAQNNTRLHDEFWNTLTRMAKVRKAQLLVGKISYNKNGWQKVTTESEGLWYDERIQPFVMDEQVKLAPTLLFCGELDILPTAIYPLNGLDNYTSTYSAIIPHTKMQMQSLATMKNDPAKLLYTTGAVTLRNYIQRRAGQLAEYNHVYGALWVEVSADGSWFVRQLNSDENGIVYDLERVWGPQWDKPIAEFGRPIINLGDIHLEKSDPVQMATAVKMLHKLKPEKVFLHDLIDFKSRNHHNLNDPHFLVAQGIQRVEDDMALAAEWLYSMTKRHKDTQFYVIRSNHDEALGQWVRNGTKFIDPPNLRYWHYLNAVTLEHIEASKPFDLFRFALEDALYEGDLSAVKFVQEDESVLIHGIEYGMHGHLGPNGARGNPKGFRQIGRRVNTGHTHSAGIIDGVWTAGVLGSLDMQYNRGPSSWSCSHIITYPNGKRTIVTQVGDKWRA